VLRKGSPALFSNVVRDQGHNMSVLGSQVDVDMEESVPDPVPKHQGHTGTGCYKLHDHEFVRPRGRPARKGGGPAEAGPPPANLMDLPVAEPAVLANSSLKEIISPAQRTYNQAFKPREEIPLQSKSSLS